MKKHYLKLIKQLQNERMIKVIINFELTRSKTGVVFTRQAVQFNIETDYQLANIDTIIKQVLSDYIKNIQEVKKFGIAYIGEMNLVSLEVTDNDKVGFDEISFREYIRRIMPKLAIIWHKTTLDTINKNGKLRNDSSINERHDKYEL